MHISTMPGPIAPEQLGVTLGHEHLLVDLRGLWATPAPERTHLVVQELMLDKSWRTGS